MNYLKILNCVHTVIEISNKNIEKLKCIYSIFVINSTNALNVTSFWAVIFIAKYLKFNRKYMYLVQCFILKLVKNKSIFFLLLQLFISKLHIIHKILIPLHKMLNFFLLKLNLNF